jgi:hypothetical protein
MKSPHLLLALAVLNIPAYIAVFGKFFDGIGDFAEGMWAWRAPRWGSISDSLSKNYGDNKWPGVKFLVACVCCGMLVLLEYGTVMDHAPAIASWLDQAW